MYIANYSLTVLGQLAIIPSIRLRHVPIHNPVVFLLDIKVEQPDDDQAVRGIPHGSQRPKIKSL